MAETNHTDRASAWNISIQHLNELNQKLGQCPPEQRDELERQIAEQEEDVLDTSAPSFGAVLTKLELLFEGQLFGLDPESEHRRLILEDLSNLVDETRELIGNRA